MSHSPKTTPPEAASSHNLRTDLMRDVLKYVVTGAVGAALAFGYTAFNPLPGRALTIVPAGIQVAHGGVIKCEDAAFISETVNAILTDEIAVPACGAAIDSKQLSRVANELLRAKAEWDGADGRIAFFRRGLDKLSALKSKTGLSQTAVSQQSTVIISDYPRIRSALPASLNGRSRLDWGLDQLSEAHNDSVKESARMAALSTALVAEVSQSDRHLDVYFLVTNSADVEFYFPTKCNLQVRDLVAPLPAQLEQLGESQSPVSQLAFVPASSAANQKP
jgi:hypothetical protein